MNWKHFWVIRCSNPLRGRLSVGLGVCLVLLLSAPVLGVLSDLTNNPANMLEKYLSLDKKGARLEAAGFEVLKPYIRWSEEPAWGQIIIIKRFKVSHDTNDWEILNSLEARIPVTFEVVGAMLWESATFVLEPRQETQSFLIQGVGNRWRIVEPMMLPHVGRKRAINFVRDALLRETDKERIQRLDILKQSLESAK